MNFFNDKVTNIREYCENKPSTFKSEIDFLSWFDRAKSINSSISSGFTDFMYKVMSADTCLLLGDPSEATCCEIGFGGGRLLLPASLIFKKAYGIDIHKDFDRVHDRLKSFNRENFELIHSTNAHSHLENDSIDFFYSLITFQHFENWETADDYINLMAKKLKPGGHGVIFFGENIENGNDIRIVNPQTYEDFPMTLYVQKSFVSEQFKSKNLKVLELGSTPKKPWLNEKSRQFYIKFQK